MKHLSVLNKPHKIILGGSPDNFDVSIAPFGTDKGSEELLGAVLSDLNYSNDIITGLNEIGHDFYWLEEDEKKPVLFIKVSKNGDLKKDLKENFENAFREYAIKFKSKTVWIPLIGFGRGLLSLEESYSIIFESVNEGLIDLIPSVKVHLSIPDTKEGRGLYSLIKHDSTGKMSYNDFEDQINHTSVMEYNMNESFNEVHSSTPNLSQSEIDEKISKVIRDFKGDFYLVDFSFENNEQVERFFQNGIWISRSSESIEIEVVSRVKAGDFLIGKIIDSSKNSENEFKILAIGIVKKNFLDGASLEVDWVLPNINFDFISSVVYRGLIQELSDSDINKLLIILGVDWQYGLFGDLGSRDNMKLGKREESEILTKGEIIAGLLSDSESGEDYLDITHDVNAFARVMAAKSFQPPLAIALFGKWGSGKSFFMSKLKEQIAFISGRDDNGVFCNGVVQIHFNAWSYMDSNLWASLVSKIFEELNFYIRDFTKTEEEKKEVENHLKSSLSIAKEEFGILNNQKRSLENQIKTLKVKKEEIEKILNDDITEIEKKTIWDVIEKVDDEFKSKEKIVEALHENESFLDSQEKLKKIVPEKYWEDPRKTYDLIKSKSVFFKLFFRPGLFQNNLLWLGLIILFVVSMGLFHWFFPWWLKNENFVIPEAVLSFLGIAGICWKRAENVFKTLQPLVVSFWDIKESYQTEITKAKSKFIQEEKALKLKIEKSKAELIQLEKQIQSVENTKADLEFRIENALATEALYSFIDRRSKSDDYKKHLGLISVIRKDFEVLNGLFLDHQEESGSQKSSIGFRERFKKPLERIILYIDDLDRCPEENVVQVLEAVNLLMAFPLFVVVVGVDARWVKNALIKKHALQFGFAGVSGNGEESKNFEKLDPSNYLEKIFQIPFQLKSATDSNVKNMIENLAQSKAKVSVESPKFENLELDDQVVDPTEELQNITKSKPQIKQDKVVGDHSIGEVRKNEEKTIKVPTKIEIKPEALVIGSDEVGLMREMSVIIGKNPRAIKRFVNIYRIIKAHEGFDNGDIIEDEDLIAVLFLIALPLGIFRELTPGIEEYVFSKNNWDSEFSDYFDFHALDIETKISLMKKQLFEIINGSEELISLVEVENSTFRKHFDFIKRFSFSHL